MNLLKDIKPYKYKYPFVDDIDHAFKIIQDQEFSESTIYSLLYISKNNLVSYIFKQMGLMNVEIEIKQAYILLFLLALYKSKINLSELSNRKIDYAIDSFRSLNNISAQLTVGKFYEGKTHPYNAMTFALSQGKNYKYRFFPYEIVPNWSPEINKLIYAINLDNIHDIFDKYGYFPTPEKIAHFPSFPFLRYAKILNRSIFTYDYLTDLEILETGHQLDSFRIDPSTNLAIKNDDDEKIIGQISNDRLNGLYVHCMDVMSSDELNKLSNQIQQSNSGNFPIFEFNVNMIVVNYKNGIMDGYYQESFTYDDNQYGILCGIKNGRLHGKYFIYEQNGEIILEKYYNNGKIIKRYSELNHQLHCTLGSCIKDVKGIISEGWYGVIYDIVLEDNRPLALKQINLDNYYNSGTISWIFEIDILSSFDHPNILGSFYVFTDWIHPTSRYKRNLNVIMETGQFINLKTMTIDEKFKVIFEILCGVEFLHRNNVIHCDIKPENIIMIGNVPKIIDFGASRYLYGKNRLPTSYYTLKYLAPEAIKSKYVTKKNDIWALGITILELLVGDKIYVDINFIENTIRNITYSVGVGGDYLTELLKGMLQLNSDSRYDINDCLSCFLFKDMIIPAGGKKDKKIINHIDKSDESYVYKSSDRLQGINIFSVLKILSRIKDSKEDIFKIACLFIVYSMRNENASFENFKASLEIDYLSWQELHDTCINIIIQLDGQLSYS